MKKTTEQRTVLKMEGKITRVNIIEGGTAIEVFSIFECAEHLGNNKLEDVKGTPEYIEKYFPIVKASTLSLEDEFLKYEPETNSEEKIYVEITEAIRSGLSDFRVQRMDPSFDNDGNICYRAGLRPAIGVSAIWWQKNAKEFMPEKGSRLGTVKERVAFLALLIKYLIEKCNYSIREAWKAVCYQSKDLGHYRDYKEKTHDIEPTGSRQIGEWFDLANTCKIILDEVTGKLSLASGCYDDFGCGFPLASIYRCNNVTVKSDSNVGWIVLPDVE